MKSNHPSQGEQFGEAASLIELSLDAGLANDWKVRHVLRAAICAGCLLILTFNLRHFKEETLEPHGIAAVNTDEFLPMLFKLEPNRIIAEPGEMAGRRRIALKDVLIRLGAMFPKFSSRVLRQLSE